MKISLKHTSIVTSIAVIGLFVTGCNSPAEKAAENTADVIEDNADAARGVADNTADKMEVQADKLDHKLDGKDTPAEKAMDNQAAAVRAQAEVKADAMDNSADAIRKAAKGK